MSLTSPRAPRTRALRNRQAPVLPLLFAACCLTSAPASANPVEADLGPLSFRLHPNVQTSDEIARETRATPERVTLASDLSARFQTPGPTMGIAIGHRGSAGQADERLAWDQRLNIAARASDIAHARTTGVHVTASAGHRADISPKAGSDSWYADFTASPVGSERTPVEMHLGWHARPGSTQRKWNHHTHGRLALTHALPGFGELAASAHMDIHPDATTSYRLGLKLDTGPHTLRLNHRFHLQGHAQRGPAITSSVYRWQLGPIGLALSADYASESLTNPASFFAGLALIFGTERTPESVITALR